MILVGFVIPLVILALSAVSFHWRCLAHRSVAEEDMMSSLTVFAKFHYMPFFLTNFEGNQIEIT